MKPSKLDWTAYKAICTITSELLAQFSDMERLLDDSQERTEEARHRVAVVCAWVDGLHNRKPRGIK